MSTEDHITHPGADERSAPEGSAPGRSGPQGAAPDQARPQEAAPEQSAPEGTSEADADLEPEQHAMDAATGAPEPDYKDLYVRAVAETDNIRKRARRDVAAAHDRGVARLAKELLPALDNLERALAHAEAQEGEGEHEITRGIRLVQQELIASLERVGIVPDVPTGEVFDPHRHDAVAHLPADGVASNTITEVYSAGYVFGEQVLRHAKVVVAQ